MLSRSVYGSVQLPEFGVLLSRVVSLGQVQSLAEVRVQTYT